MIVTQRHAELQREAQKHRQEQVQGDRSLSQEQANRRQMLYLFGSIFIILFTGMGLFPILPLYAAQFGANPALTGIYLGVVYTAIAAGTLLTGWLAGRFSPRGLFIAGGALGVPALALLGQHRLRSGGHRCVVLRRWPALISKISRSGTSGTVVLWPAVPGDAAGRSGGGRHQPACRLAGLPFDVRRSRRPLGGAANHRAVPFEGRVGLPRVHPGRSSQPFWRPAQ
jgi:hypothetical protein